MMWLRCCCYCCCCTDAEEEKDSNTVDDSSSLIVQHPFYVPRRHSSFQPTKKNASNTGKQQETNGESRETSLQPDAMTSLPHQPITAKRKTCSDIYNFRLARWARSHSSMDTQIGTSNPAFVESGRVHSDGSSSSDDERVPESRGRCWSTIPASDVTAFVASQRNQNKLPLDSDLSSGKVQFDKHFLSEIMELEQGEQEESNHHPCRTDDSEVNGHIIFTTIYDDQEQRLKVFLKQATGLPKKGEHPYGTFVKTSLTSGKNLRMSRPSKKISNPVYDEEHVFQINRSKWKLTSYLRLSVFDCDRQGRHDAIGHALLLLEDIGKEVQEHCLPLTPMSLPVKNLGQILIGLLYSPTQSRLAIHVIKARHLRLDDEAHKRHLRPLHKDVLDSFCKVTLTCGGQKVKTCRSRPATGFDPFFDFRTSFVVPPQYLRDTGIIVSVVARSTLGREGATLGRAPVLGPYVEKSDGSATQWGKMIQESRSTVQWRNLYL